MRPASTLPVAGPEAAEAQALDARASVRLDGREGALRVLAGELHVFVARPGGRRRPFLVLGPGDCAIGFPDAGPDLQVLASGDQACRVVDVAEDARLEAREVAWWITRLSGPPPQSSSDPAPDGVEPAGLEALGLLRRRAGLQLARDLGAQSRIERERVVRRREQDAGKRKAALGLLAGVVRPAREGDRTAAAGGDGMEQACVALAGALSNMTEPKIRLQQAAHLGRRFGVRVRTVLLRGTWWDRVSGPLVAWTAGDHLPIAIVPGRRGRRAMVDPISGRSTPLDRASAERLAPEAVALYRLLPDGPVGPRRLAAWLATSIRPEFLRLAMTCTLLALLALAAPALTAVVVTEAIGGADVGSLAFCAAALVAAAAAGAGIQLIQTLAVLRLGAEAEGALQAALVDRILRLPTRFFRAHPIGELFQRLDGVQVLRSLLPARLAAGATSLCVFLASLGLMALIDGTLLLPVLGLAALQVLVVAGLSLRRLRDEQAYYEARTRTSSLVVQMVTAVGKLRVAGAAGRALGVWMTAFAEQKRWFVRGQRTSGLLTAFNGAYPLIAILLIYALAAERLGTAGGSLGTTIAFFAAFGQASAALGVVAATGGEVVGALPFARGLATILRAEPELLPVHSAAPALTGRVEVREIRFAYPGQTHPVLDGFSLKVAAREFVAVVGASGSGKSTLFRLLLGFEHPLRGSVLYDGRNLESLDLDGVRSQIGVVLQGGRLRPGSIYENICGAFEAPTEQVWEAARRAGIAADIQAMPMGMRTMVSEGGGTLSGGQRQRLMIARALVREPKLLLFDEATSALDNATQAAVAAAVAELDVTRIVIAHRVSTIRGADRILVLEHRRVVQEGTFDALSDVEGPFAALVRRQML